MSANDKQVGGDHYKKAARGTQEHWDYAWQHGYDQFQYCITKYVDRHKHREGLKDLRKAQHHLEKYIELLEEEAKLRAMSVEVSMQEQERRKAANMSWEEREAMLQFGAQSMAPREYVNPDL